MTRKLKSLKLFIISIIIFTLTIIAGSFWNFMGFSNQETPILAVFIMIAFGINIAGVIFGFDELNANKKKSIFGIISNSIFLVLYLSIAVFAVLNMI